MKVILHPPLPLKLRGTGIEHRFSWPRRYYEDWKNGVVTVDAAQLTPDQLDVLEKLLLTRPDDHKALSSLYTLRLWRSALRDPTNARPQNVEQAPDMLRLWLDGVPGHRLYRQEETGIWVPYVVESISSSDDDTSRSRRDGERNAVFVSIKFAYSAGGEARSFEVHLTSGDIRVPVKDILARKGWRTETASLREAYERDMERMHKLVQSPGSQYLARGWGRPLDSRTWAKKLALSRQGKPARVIVDDPGGVVPTSLSLEEEVGWEDDAGMGSEDDDPFDDNVDTVDNDFWADKPTRNGKQTPKTQVDAPLWPYVPVFDLGRQVHVRVHARSLRPYVYDRAILDQLIIPTEQKELVGMLAANGHSGIRDIVSGKGEGVTLLLRGAPGLGKTITAEVFAEALGRPLYSVQSSQLGTDLNTLEQNLREVIRRAAKWGAVLLIDEADVFVQKRRDDLFRNAVVGVFLRVLEYHNGVLFLTTNRGTEIDDAVVSRCMVVIDYGLPGPEGLAQILSVLAALSDLKVKKEVLVMFAKRHPDATGRDARNVLDLGSKWAQKRGTGLGLKMLELAWRYRPSREEGDVER